MSELELDYDKPSIIKEGNCLSSILSMLVNRETSISYRYRSICRLRTCRLVINFQKIFTTFILLIIIRNNSFSIYRFVCHKTKLNSKSKSNRHYEKIKLPL
jgi:hypothetical protein